MGFWVDFELLGSVGILAEKEGATLSNLIGKTEVVDEWFDQLADGVDLAVFEPVVDNDSFVALDDN